MSLIQKSIDAAKLLFGTGVAHFKTSLVKTGLMTSSESLCGFMETATHIIFRCPILQSPRSIPGT